MKPVLFFDIDYTLTHFDHEAGMHRLKRAATRLLGPRNAERLAAIVEEQFRAHLSKTKEGKGISRLKGEVAGAEGAHQLLWSRELWCLHAAERLRLPLTHADCKALADEYWKGIEKGSVAYPETYGVLASLSRKGYRIYFATGSDARLKLVNGRLAYSAEYSKKLKLNRLPPKLTRFAKAIVVGDPDDKPSKEFFARALKAARVKNPAHAVVIGDSHKMDVEGGNAAGMATILIDRHERYGTHEARHKSADLREVGKIIEAMEAWL